MPVMRLRMRSPLRVSALTLVVMLACLTMSASAGPAAEGATPDQWVTTSLPNEPGLTSSGLNGVSCLSATSCVAVGQDVLQSGTGQSLPLVATFHDGTWSFTPLPEPAAFPADASAELDSVSCVTTTACVAVGGITGSANAGFAEILSGGSWQPVTTFGSGPASTSLSSVSCTSATSCVAVGDGTASGSSVIAMLSGSTWSTQSSQTPISDISCPTPSYCMAVGQRNTGLTGLHAEVFDGSSWTPVDLPLPPGITSGSFPGFGAVSCWAAASCLVGGSAVTSVLPFPPESFTLVYSGIAEVLSGTTATSSTVVLGTSGISGVSCSSANSCAAVTSAGSITSVATFINGAWAAAGGNASGNAVSCIPATCVTVGASGDGTSTSSQRLGFPFVGLAATADNQGYWLANQAGGVWNYGSAAYSGSLGDVTLNQPVVGIASTPGGGGYWEDAADGGVFTFGDASFYGSTGGIKLNQPMVGMAALPNGTGYWLVAADGGIFSYGAAQFYGSMGGTSLNKPIVGMASTPDGNGYWLVASDGGVFAFGDAAFWGSMGGKPLNKPVVGMAADPLTGGYWEVASDGGIFAFNAPFYGSTGAITLNQPITAMDASPTGLGYRFVARDGGVFDFGDSSFFGSPA